MNPGFLSLFSRSLYRGSADRSHWLDPESKESRRMHEERERFAAAAIGFCLHHDDDFLWHFWRKVCRKRGESKPRTKPTVQIEPRRWSDLLLRWEGAVCAVEIKIGAALSDHQNPGKKAFAEPGGYGDFLAGFCAKQPMKCRRRYVVLGWEPDIETRSRNDELGLEIEQRRWADFEAGLPHSPLAEDLISLLSSFGIWQFTFRSMKNKKLSGKLGDIGSAIAILESVRDSLGWPKSTEVKAWQGDHWELGIYLGATARRKPVEGLAQQLKRINEPKDNCVAWFGYFAEKGNVGQRCVYVYCSKAARRRLVNRLNTAEFVVADEPGSDRDGPEGDYCAIVRQGRDELDDIEWLKTILETAGGMPHRNN
jgi:hypothetical protein